MGAKIKNKTKIRRAPNNPPPPQKKKKKNPRTKNLPPYLIRRTTRLGYVGTTVYQESSDCFEYPKKSLLNSSHQKRYLQNFPTQKIPELKISNPQKILRSLPSLEIWSIPLGVKTDIKFCILHPGFRTLWSSG